MDQKGDQNSMIIINGQNKITTYEPNNNTITLSSLKKNNKGSKNFFKVALFMMRGRRSRKSKMLIKDDESKSVWRKLVGSMRPLHLQDNDQSSPPRNDNIYTSPDHSSKMMTVSTPSEISGDDGFETSSEFTSSPSPASSRYASAVGLNEMVQEEEKEEEVVKENNNNNDIDTGEGDEMIDAKAEEFIAQFYQQMRLQRLDVMDSHYQEISARSLGL